MPKVASQRTFTACWTCRRRNIRCDTVSPICSQCRRSGFDCEGYDIRLVWVDSETGSYESKQRRSFPCRWTWDGYPTWTLDEVGHLITHATRPRRCRCHLHRHQSPFLVFPSDKSDDRAANYDKPPAEDELPSQEGLLDEVLGDSVEAFVHEEVEVMYASDVAVSAALPLPFTETRSCSKTSLPYEHSEADMALTLAPKLSSLMSPLVPDGSSEDNALFYHYISLVSKNMMPIDDDHNPWKTTYPCLAVYDENSTSSRSLLHAILAQSAYHMSNVDSSRTEEHRQVATTHFGVAVRHLRESLSDPLEYFTSTLAAMLAVTLAQHVFDHQLKGLSIHLQGAFEYVRNHLSRKPWASSYEAWLITQSFVLHGLMSRITGCGSPTSTSCAATTLHQVLEDVSVDPRFAYTLGSTPRLMKALYKACLLDEQLVARDCARTESRPDLSEDELLQAGNILMELNAPLDDEVETYVKRQRVGEITTDQRAFIVSNLNLFSSAVTIYLLGVTLRHPPSAIAGRVFETLSNAFTVLQIAGCSISVWPVFIASAEAYTGEAQALASVVWGVLSKRFGTCNRKMLYCIVQQIWAERERTAADRSCDVGDVLVDWHGMLKRFDMEILVL